jgi:hypothetical protein
MISFSLLLIALTSYSQKRLSHLYANNLTIKPFNANSVGVGIGVQFEKYLDTSHNLSFVLPIDYSFEVSTNNYFTNDRVDNFGFDINPGFRFYFVEPRTFNWYIGCSFMLGYENSDFKYYNPNGGYDIFKSTRTSFGSLINVGFKGTIKDRITYNVEVGNGIKFIEKFSSSINLNYYTNSRYLGSILAGFGYNF